jgi:hypothetical protein
VNDEDLRHYDRIVNERIYFDSASLVTQIDRAEPLALAGGA